MKTTPALFLLPFLASAVFAADTQLHKLAYEQSDAVWVANIDGSNPKKIADGQSPDLSPDGTKLVFNTVQAIGQPAHRQIAVADLTSGSITIFNDIPGTNCMEARWSPDGAAILFYYYANNDRRIGIVNADGTGFRDVQKEEPKHVTYWADAWAADGKSFFCEDMESICQLDLDAKVLKKWAVKKIVPDGDLGGNVRLDVSSDGKKLLMDLEMNEKERKAWDGPPPAIWALNIESGKTTRISSEQLYAWDGHWLGAAGIVFCSQGKGEKSPSVYRMSLNGKDRKLLIKDATVPSVSP